MKKIIVLGAGMVGSAIAVDLSKNYDVTSADINLQNLSKLKKQKIKTIQGNISDKEVLLNLVEDFDLIIGAVPGFMGYKTLRTVIEAGKDVVDISFFSEDPFELDSLAKRKNVTAVVDCGVAPGLSNIILGYHNKRMKIDSFKCFVGGLPFKRIMPFQYKAPFSPVDVIEEYIRPARVVENGVVVIKEALSEPELIEAEGVGTLEAFNTDGLRSLLKTMKIPFMSEKTLRYPGHIEIIKVLKQAGYFSDEEMDVNGVSVKPVDISAKLLFPLWKLDEDEREFTYLQFHIKGGKKEFTYRMFDSYNDRTKTSSMARTTGYTCAAAADLILKGKYKRKGISPPEYLGEDESCFLKIRSYLEERGIVLNEN
ncbi:MAG: saccharopine dehydrogenase [Ignavibacteriales bacterium]|nr:MAG: saccharopine dehydrogenase [Ignavibacteriales bacterium]